MKNINCAQCGSVILGPHIWIKGGKGVCGHCKPKYDELPPSRPDKHDQLFALLNMVETLDYE